MVKGLIGKKLGMTQVFDEQGMAVPVTVIQAGPCIVVQLKTPERDGYSAAQLGLVEGRKAPRLNKPLAGHFTKVNAAPSRVLREFGLRPETDSENAEVKPGDQLLVHQVFQVGDWVNVSGRTIGKGFQGVIKRHGFRGGKATHGSMFHRAPGSIGASAYPSRVLPGMRAAGRMGGTRVTIRRLRVVGLDEERNLLLVRGAVPGKPGNHVFVSRTES